MSVISISVMASKDQVVSGIPRTVSIFTNIPAIIFFTLNGSPPTVDSMQYAGPIVMPTDRQTVVLHAFASNGACSSPIVSEMYQTDKVNGNIRTPHSGTTAQPEANLQNMFPYGANNIDMNSVYTGTASVGITVDDPNKPEIPTGFDGGGHPTGFTNEPYNFQNYAIQYSTTDNEGRMGHGKGNLPAEVKVEPPVPAYGPEQTFQTFTSTFDPKAFVIFQDASKENPLDPPMINREHFSLQNDDRVRGGDNHFVCGLDAPPVSGGFVRSAFNPRDNTMTYYYYDSWANRWLISKQPYNPTGTYDGNLTGHWALGAKRFVHEWIPWQHHTLF